MQKQQKPKRGPGRPPIEVISERLRGLREEAGLTQIELAKRVYRRLGQGKTSLSVMKTTYQRWERTGAISQTAAKHLADELNTTVAVLRGATPEVPASALERIEARLRHEVATENSAALIAAERYAEDDDPVAELARSVARRLEAAQVSQDWEELSKLAALTGWSVSDLQLPVGGEGHWLLVGLGILGAARTEIVQSSRLLAHEVLGDLRDVLARLHASDASVSFHEEAPWFRVEVRHPRISQLTRTLRFVRAQPTEKGLHWTKPTMWDREVLGRLPYDVWSMVNFVTGFSHEEAVPLDLTRLRLVLITRPKREDVEKHWPEDPPTEVAGVAKLACDEPPASVLESFRRDGFTHDLVTQWLAGRMWDEILQPLFEASALEYWRFGKAQCRIDVFHEIPLRVAIQRGEIPRLGPAYRIELVRELPSGELREVPWRDSSVASVRKCLEESLDRAREKATVAAAPP